MLRFVPAALNPSRKRQQQRYPHAGQSSGKVLLPPVLQTQVLGETQGMHKTRGDMHGLQAVARMGSSQPQPWLLYPEG